MTDDDNQEDYLRDNCQAVLDKLDPFEEMVVTEANLSVLSSSDKGTHKATIWFDIKPEDLEIRDFANLVMPLHVHILYLYQLARDRLRIEDRDERIKGCLEEVEAELTTPENALAEIRDLMDDG